MPVRELWEYIDAELAPFAPLEVDGLRGDGESTAVQAGRSEPVVREYLDGAVSGSLFFELRSRSQDRVRAWGWLQEAVDHFLGRRRIQLERGLLFAVRPVSAPYLIDRAGGWYVYAAQFEMEYDEMPQGMKG